MGSIFKGNLLQFATFSLIGCFLHVTGCQTSRPLTHDLVDSKGKDIRISSVQLKDGKTFDFTSEPLGYALLRDSSICHMKTDGTIELIPLTKVDLSKSERLSSTSESVVDNVIWVVMGTGILVLILLSTIHFDVGG